MRKKRIYLTGVSEVLKEEVKQKQKVVEGVPRCDNGHTREFYEEMNVPEERIPQELKDKEVAEDVDDESDYEEVYSKVSLYEEDILLMISSEKDTVVFLKDSDLSISVVETVEEIEDIIKELNMNWLNRVGKYLISKITNKKDD